MDRDGNNTLQIKAIGVVISTFETLPSVEAAHPRHAHAWHLWEHVTLPTGTILIPGVVGHDADTIEHPELVAERLCNDASVGGRDHVIAGTDGGFGTSRLHPTIAHLRLQTLVEGARLALQKLWDRSEVSA